MEHEHTNRPGAEARSLMFARFYQQHHEAVVRYLWAKVHRWEDVEDLAELAFTKALDGWERCEYPADGRKAWLTRIAGNVAIDHFRWAGLRSTIDLAGAMQMAGPDDPVRDAEAAAIRACFRHALERLPARQRHIARLYFGGIPEREIGRTLGLSVGAVKSAVYRIRRTLRCDPSLRAWAA